MVIVGYDATRQRRDVTLKDGPGLKDVLYRTNISKILYFLIEKKNVANFVVASNSFHLL